MTPRPLATLFLILAVVFAVYSPSLTNGFAMDDRLVAMGSMDAGRTNPMVIELRPLAEYFSSHYWTGSQPADHLFRPITILSYALRHQVFGDMPLPAHLANILLHLAAVAITFWMLHALGAGRLATALGATVFGLHAIHSEVVSTVVGRAELLAFVFGGAALWCWRTTRSRRPAVRWLGGTGAALGLFLALGSKESAIAWPPFFVVFAAAAHWHGHRRSMTGKELRASILEVLACAAVPIAGYLVLRAQMIAALPVDPAPTSYLVNQLADLSWVARLPSALNVWGYALLLTLFPFHLAADYSTAVFPTLDSPFDPRAIGVALLFVTLLVAAIRYRIAHPGLFVAAACFFGFSFLISNVPLAIGTIFGERLYYAPSLATAFVGAWLVERCRERDLGEKLLLFCLGAWLATSATVLVSRHEVWQDDTTLFLHEAQNQPRSVRMHTTAARQNADRGAPALAIAHLLEASRLDPENALVWNNLGALYLDAKDLERAEHYTRQGLAARHIQGSEDLYKLHTNLGLIKAAAGRVEPALEQMRLALGHRPGFIRIYQELLGWLGRGAITEAQILALFDAVGQTQPTSRPYLQIYRGLLAHAGRRPQAGEQLLALGLQDLPSYDDRCQWQHDIAVHLIAHGTADPAIPRLMACLELQPHRLDSFIELVKLTGARSLTIEALQGWVALGKDTPTWRLYRALSVYQHGVLTHDVVIQRRARADLQAVLPDLSRWRYRGRLYAEARLELGRLCRLLGDKPAADRLLRALADDAAIPAARRAEARAILEE